MVATFLFMCVWLIYSLFSECLPPASARTSSRARHWSMDGVNDALFNAAPNAQQAMTLNIAVTSNVVGETQEKNN